MNTNNPIIFFDGHCNLCNYFVNFVFRRDKVDLYRFAPLQGETAKKYLKQSQLKELNTVVLLQKDNIYVKSEAALIILKHTSSIGKTLHTISRFLPTSFNDFIYDLIAHNRYRIFGKKNTCRVPGEKEKSKFLP